MKNIIIFCEFCQFFVLLSRRLTAFTSISNLQGVMGLSLTIFQDLGGEYLPKGALTRLSSADGVNHWQPQQFQPRSLKDR
jgi:hypothetical protein